MSLKCAVVFSDVWRCNPRLRVVACQHDIMRSTLSHGLRLVEGLFFWPACWWKSRGCSFGYMSGCVRQHFPGVCPANTYYYTSKHAPAPTTTTTTARMDFGDFLGSTQGRRTAACVAVARTHLTRHTRVMCFGMSQSLFCVTHLTRVMLWHEPVTLLPHISHV